MDLQQYFGKGKIKGNSITFEKHRQCLNPHITGISVSGGDVDEAFISIIKSKESSYLIISEIPCLSQELRDLTQIVINIGGTVTAIHNHWITDEPRIYYLHWQMITTDIQKNIKLLLYLWHYLDNTY
jgi:hypothetical protein